MRLLRMGSTGPGVQLLQLALIDHCYSVAQRFSFFDVVSSEQNSHISVIDLSQQIPHLAP